MKLKLEKPIVFFDLETTGVDTAHDRIVEICLIRLEPNGNRQSLTMRLNPTIPIPAQASEVHGIYDADIQDCPTFKDKSEELERIFAGCDIAGFNSNKFDVPLLVEEFLRCGIYVDFSQTRLVDVQNIYHKLERRTLIAAYKFYCDKDLENAHSALADTEATLEVLEAQLDHYPDVLQNDIEFLSEYSRRDRNVDFAGRFVYNDQDIPVVNFGKYKGRPVQEILMRDPSYYNWIMQGDFTLNTKQVLTQLKFKYLGK